MLSFDEDHYLLVKLHQTETLPANCNYAIISPAPSTNDINVKKCRERQTKGKDKQDRFFKTIFLLMQTQRDAMICSPIGTCHLSMDAQSEED